MNKDYQITIELKPHLADFCRHEFKCDEYGRIFLSRKHDIGRHVYSMLLTSDMPVKKPVPDNPVTFIIPVTSTNHYEMKHRFVYVSKWGEEKIQDFIESEFNQRMRLLFEAGYRKRYSQKQIVEAILQAYNIRHTTLNYDSVKKSDYRQRRKNRKIIFDDLQRVDL